MPQRRHTDPDTDRFGFEATSDYLGAAVSRLLPTGLVRRGISLSVETDRDEYASGAPVRVRVTFHNSLPVPISIGTSTRRQWGWELDGLLEASDEPRRDPGGSAELVFRARERKTFLWTWDGRVKRVTDEGTHFVPLKPGEHELRTFVGTRDGSHDATVTFRVK